MGDPECLALCLAGTAAAKDIDRKSLGQESTWQYARLLRQAKFVLADIADRFANSAYQMVMGAAVQFHAERPVVQAHLAEDAAFEEEMNVLINSRQRNGRDPFLDADVHFFRAGVSGHALQHFEEHLPLVGHGNAMSRAQLAKLLCVQSIHYF